MKEKNYSNFYSKFYAKLSDRGELEILIEKHLAI
jgi:hypothetical protein